MALTRTAVCKYYISEADCEKGLEGTFKKACQTCKFYVATQAQQPRKKKQNYDPNEVWQKKKEKSREARLKQQMLEDLEYEDG